MADFDEQYWRERMRAVLADRNDEADPPLPPASPRTGSRLTTLRSELEIASAAIEAAKAEASRYVNGGAGKRFR